MTEKVWAVLARTLPFERQGRDSARVRTQGGLYRDFGAGLPGETLDHGKADVGSEVGRMGGRGQVTGVLAA